MLRKNERRLKICTNRALHASFLCRFSEKEFFFPTHGWRKLWVGIFAFGLMLNLPHFVLRNRGEWVSWMQYPENMKNDEK
jgi:hypothetical protein